jgi:hypothetical protein
MSCSKVCSLLHSCPYLALTDNSTTLKIFTPASTAISTLSVDPTVSEIVTVVSFSTVPLLISACPTGWFGESTGTRRVGVKLQLAWLSSRQSCLSVSAWA